MTNFWRQLRLAGLVMMCAGSWIPNLSLFAVGSLFLMWGILYGLSSIERRFERLVEILDKERTHEKTDTN